MAASSRSLELLGRNIGEVNLNFFEQCGFELRPLEWGFLDRGWKHDVFVGYRPDFQRVEVLKKSTPWGRWAGVYFDSEKESDEIIYNYFGAFKVDTKILPCSINPKHCGVRMKYIYGEPVVLIRGSTLRLAAYPEAVDPNQVLKELSWIFSENLKLIDTRRISLGLNGNNIKIPKRLMDFPAAIRGLSKQVVLSSLRIQSNPDIGDTALKIIDQDIEQNRMAAWIIKILMLQCGFKPGY